MGLAVLIVGLLIFLATHVFVSMRGARAAAIARLGTIGYRIAFSVVSVVGLVLIVWGFGHYRCSAANGSTSGIRRLSRATSPFC